MRTLAIALVGVVALLDFWFLVLEMFLRRTRARRVFGMTAEQAEATATLAANQGLYSGFPSVQAMPAGAALLAPWMGLPR